MRIHLVGAGGFAREVLDIIEALIARGAPLEVGSVHADGGGDRQELATRGYELAGPIAALGEPHDDDRFVVAFNQPEGRAKAAEMLRAAGWESVSLVHPDATVGSQLSSAEGLVVCAGARIGTNVMIGRHVHVNANCTIGHDAVIEDYVSINPLTSVGGRVVVRQAALIGAGATVVEKVEVGAHAVVGAGAVVIRDVEPATTVAGVPARPLSVRDG